MNKIFVAICFFLICNSIIAQQNNFPDVSNVNNETSDTKISRHKIISGVVLDEKTRKPIPSATIRIEGTNKGTIAAKDGTFRLPKGNFINKSDVKVTSVGYHTKIISLDLTKDSATILLKQNPIELNAAVVIGEIEVNEIIRRAIKKKDENRIKYNTMQGLLYSKFTIDMSSVAKNLLTGMSSSGNNTINLNVDPLKSQKQKEDSLKADFMQGIIAETFSQKYVDIEKNLDKTIIVNRRQTANFPRGFNQIVLEKFVDFSQDEIDFIDAKIITPLHKNALTHYKFELIEKKLFEDKFVYVINVIPNTKVYPTFQGTISIIEGTYQLIEANLKPSANTKIHLIDELEYYEKFENVKNDAGVNIWFPTYMENKASFKMKVFPGIPQIEVEWSTISIFSEVIVNQPLPDSVYYDKIDTTFDAEGNIISTNEIKTWKTDAQGNLIPQTIVLPDADSTKNEYWEDNALISLTDKEQEMYASIDTAAKELKIDVNTDTLYNTNTQQKNKFSWNYFPVLNYNRVVDYTCGLMTNVNIPFTKLSGTGLYSIGQYRWFGNAKIEFGNNLKRGGLFSFSNISSIMPNKPSYSVSGEIFSNVRSFSNSSANTDLYVSMLDMWIFDRDYFDYFNTDGWNTQLNFNYKKLYLNAVYENRRDFVLNNSTYTGFWSKKDFSKYRSNPQSETGRFQFIKLSSSFGNNISSLLERFQYKFSVNYQYGIREKDIVLQDVRNGKYFSQLYGSAIIQFPIFETGYGNMLLLLSATGGWADNNTPVQHLFAIPQTSLFSNLFSTAENKFLTAYETYYGGTEFFTYYAKLNLRDWWWRLLRLPKIKGRGLELSLTATTGKFFNKGNTELSDLYHTTKGYYSEAGFVIGRIPIPGTDLIYWSLETRLGVGKNTKGRYGFLLNFSLPFSF